MGYPAEEPDFASLRAIQEVVRCLDRGQQPKLGEHLFPAIDHEYAEFEMHGEKLGPLMLTKKGSEAAVRWRRLAD